MRLARSGHRHERRKRFPPGREELAVDVGKRLIQEMACVGLRRPVRSPLRVFGKLGNCDGRQNPDDHHHDHQLNQRETTLPSTHGDQNLTVN